MVVLSPTLFIGHSGNETLRSMSVGPILGGKLQKSISLKLSRNSNFVSLLLIISFFHTSYYLKFTEKSDIHILGKQNNFRRKFSYPDRYQAYQGECQRSKIGAAYAEYEMLPSHENSLGHNIVGETWANQETTSSFNSNNKHALYKKAASAFSLPKYDNDNEQYSYDPSSSSFGHGIVYDTDCKYHYDRILVVPGNDKWRNSSSYSKSTMSTNSSDNSYSIPKPLPRRDSLRGRTKSIFQSKQAINSYEKSDICIPNELSENKTLPNTVDLGSLTLNRALSAPPASPRHLCTQNRFTWWFDSTSSEQTPKMVNKSNRYVTKSQ